MIKYFVRLILFCVVLSGCGLHRGVSDDFQLDQETFTSSEAIVTMNGDFIGTFKDKSNKFTIYFDATDPLKHKLSIGVTDKLINNSADQRLRLSSAIKLICIKEICELEYYRIQSYLSSSWEVREELNQSMPEWENSRRQLSENSNVVRIIGAGLALKDFMAFPLE